MDPFTQIVTKLFTDLVMRVPSIMASQFIQKRINDENQAARNEEHERRLREGYPPRDYSKKKGR